MASHWPDALSIHRASVRDLRTRPLIPTFLLDLRPWSSYSAFGPGLRTWLACSAFGPGLGPCKGSDFVRRKSSQCKLHVFGGSVALLYRLWA